MTPCPFLWRPITTRRSKCTLAAAVLTPITLLVSVAIAFVRLPKSLPSIRNAPSIPSESHRQCVSSSAYKLSKIVVRSSMNGSKPNDRLVRLCAFQLVKVQTTTNNDCDIHCNTHTRCLPAGNIIRHAAVLLLAFSCQILSPPSFSPGLIDAPYWTRREGDSQYCSTLVQNSRWAAPCR
jgi:hypothetical protein